MKNYQRLPLSGLKGFQWLVPPLGHTVHPYSFGAGPTGAVFLRLALVRGGAKKRGLRKNMERVGCSGDSSHWDNFLLDQANQSLQKSMEQVQPPCKHHRCIDYS